MLTKIQKVVYLGNQKRKGLVKMEIIKLYDVGQKIKNPKNGQVFEIIEREILEEVKETLYKIETEHQGNKICVEMNGQKLNGMISQGLEVL